jgi:hypothetical protein
MSCYVTDPFALVTISVKNSGGDPYPGTAIVALSADAGQVAPASLTISGGSGSARYYPPAVATNQTYTVTAQVTNPVSTATATATLMCEAPTIF